MTQPGPQPAAIKLTVCHACPYGNDKYEACTHMHAGLSLVTCSYPMRSLPFADFSQPDVPPTGVSEEAAGWGDVRSRKLPGRLPWIYPGRISQGWPSVWPLRESWTQHPFCKQGVVSPILPCRPAAGLHCLIINLGRGSLEPASWAAPLVTTPAMPWDLLHAAAMPAKRWSDASMHIRQPPPCSASGLAEADLAPCTPHAHRLLSIQGVQCLLSPTCGMPQSLT